MTTWHTTGPIPGDLWPDADQIDGGTLMMLLAVARDQVIAYAPARGSWDEEIPERFVLAQLRQAQNLWRAATVKADGGIGDGDSYQVTVFPLDWHVKNLIRPTRGRPHVR